MPLASQIHIDRPLSNFSLEYKNKKMIATEAVPFIPVQKKSDTYMSYTQKDRFTLGQTIRGPKDTANEVDWTATYGSYSCVDHAMRHFIPDAQAANADPGVDYRRRTSNFLTDLILLAYERVIATMLFTAGSYGASYKATLSSGDQWSAFATSDPIANVETAMEACFVRPNTMIIGRAVWSKLKQHPQILARITGGSTTGDPAKISKKLVAELFEVDRLLVGEAKYNSANKGAAAAVFTDVWGKFAWLGYIDPSPGLDSITAASAFRWNQLSTNMGFQVRTYRDESKGGGGEWIEVETSYDEVQPTSDLAFLYSTVVA